MEGVRVVFVTRRKVSPPLLLPVLVDESKEVKDELFDDAYLKNVTIVSKWFKRLLFQRITYHFSLFDTFLLFEGFEVGGHLHLHLSVVVFVTVTLVGETFLGHLLVEHSVLGLVDGVRLRNFLHRRDSTFLAKVKRHFRDVVELGSHELLLVGWCRNQAGVHTLDTHEDVKHCTRKKGLG